MVSDLLRLVVESSSFSLLSSNTHTREWMEWRFAERHRHFFYTLLALQIVVLVFGVFGLTNKAPKNLRYKSSPPLVHHRCGKRVGA